MEPKDHLSYLRHTIISTNPYLAAVYRPKEGDDLNGVLVIELKFNQHHINLTMS